MEGLDALRKARTTVLDELASQTVGWHVDELDKLYKDMSDEFTAVPVDVLERDALQRLGRAAVALVLTCTALAARRAARTSKVVTNTSFDSSLQSAAQPSRNGSTQAS